MSLGLSCEIQLRPDLTRESRKLRGNTEVFRRNPTAALVTNNDIIGMASVNEFNGNDEIFFGGFEVNT